MLPWTTIPLREEQDGKVDDVGRERVRHEAEEQRVREQFRGPRFRRRAAEPEHEERLGHRVDPVLDPRNDFVGRELQDLCINQNFIGRLRAESCSRVAA